MYPGDHARQHPDQPALVMAHERRAADVRRVRGQRQPAGPPVPGGGVAAGRSRRPVHGEPPALLRDDVGGRAQRPLLHVHQLVPHAGGGRLHRRQLRRQGVHHHGGQGRRSPSRRPSRRPRSRCSSASTPSAEVGPFQPYDAALAAHPAEHIPDEQLGAAMLYSSGTTGRPKGILRPLPDAHPAEALPVMSFIVDHLFHMRRGDGVPVAGADLPLGPAGVGGLRAAPRARRRSSWSASTPSSSWRSWSGTGSPTPRSCRRCSAGC